MHRAHDRDIDYAGLRSVTDFFFRLSVKSTYSLRQENIIPDVAPVGQKCTWARGVEVDVGSAG